MIHNRLLEILENGKVTGSSPYNKTFNPKKFLKQFAPKLDTPWQDENSIPEIVNALNNSKNINVEIIHKTRCRDNMAWYFVKFTTDLNQSFYISDNVPQYPYFDFWQTVKGKLIQN